MHGDRLPDEILTCRECGVKFNLAAQHYYDNLCPPCKVEHEGDETVAWPPCARCGEQFEPGSGTFARVPNPGVRGGSERVHVCSAECKAKMEPGGGPR